ncbi:MAG TPA: dephospho-CoA kinase [Sulfurovum sp.]|nr:dephospho-CoA kinase [Sulfurovum sp.]
MRYKHAIALSGSIATGKSSVASIFLEFGFSIIDADKIAHRILDKQADKIAKIFGKQYCTEQVVDRKALGSLVFADKKAKEKLESLLHPLIEKEIERLSLELDKLGKPYLVDIPLFFEFERYDISSSIVVYAPLEIQLSRLMTRDECSKDEAYRRINSQMDIELKKSKATYVIDNSKDMIHLRNECMHIRDLILKEYKV